MEFETARLILIIITSIASVIWLAGLLFLLKSRQGQAPEEADGMPGLDIPEDSSAPHEMPLIP